MTLVHWSESILVHILDHEPSRVQKSLGHGHLSHHNEARL
jgi:hypothetical protein